MQNTKDIFEARLLLADAVKPMASERVPLAECAGRVLFEDAVAAENVPPFDRSPLDGYAFRAADTESASKDAPVELRILEEIPAGSVPHFTVKAGTATKILTGAPIPPGVDAVSKYEETEFTESAVKLFRQFKSGENIVLAGEDVRAGELLARAGDVIDPACAGVLASQGVAAPLVYRRPRAGIISTGNEVVEVDCPLANGKLRDSNRYTLEAACARLGCDTTFLGIAGDTAEDVAGLLLIGLAECDIIFMTGGASVGDYDMTPAAIKLVGAELLVRHLSLKPGGACAYGIKDGVLICGLSGNPASAMTNFYGVASPAVKKLCGRRDYMPGETVVTLAEDFPSKSPQLRLIRGVLDLSDGTVRMHIPDRQGNSMLHSLIGCDVMAVVPAGSDKLSKGTRLKGLLL